MFDNIGGKIKSLATVSTWLGILISIFAGIGILPNSILVGLLVMVVGSIASWIGSLVLYGFGQLVENTDKLVQKDTIVDKPEPKENKQMEKRIENMKKLLDDGLITETEYLNRVRKIQEGK